MTAEREGVAELEQHIEVLRELRDDYRLCGPTEYSEALSAAIRALRQGGGWLPIESAPKDGTWVLLAGGSIQYNWDGGTVPDAVVGQYTDYLNGGRTDPHWQFAWYDGGYYGEYCGPTHWRPLPAPPSPAKEG